MVKELLSSFEEVVNYIQCDDYLVNKELFMAFIEFKGAKRQFPMVFFDGIYIGGFAETLKLCKTK
jgi:glutaredoxin